jgi:hypothetical protein
VAFRTDQVLWYNNGEWGRLGYAVPNVGDDPVTVNQGCRYLVEVMGRNLSAVMHSPDADMRRPPTINTLIRVHKLITRARTILAGRAVPSSTPQMEAIHATPAPQDPLIFPVPYFNVRNPWMKEYCGLTLAALGEAAQHTDNRQSYDFSLEFSGVVGQYLHRVYRLMATELFGVKNEEAAKPDFTLSEAVFATYNPSQWFTSTELIDTVPVLTDIPTEDDVRVLTDGIPATLLVNVQKWPSGGTLGGSSAPTTSGTSGGANASFAPSPAP